MDMPPPQGRDAGSCAEITRLLESDIENGFFDESREKCRRVKMGERGVDCQRAAKEKRGRAPRRLSLMREVGLARIGAARSALLVVGCAEQHFFASQGNTLKTESGSANHLLHHHHHQLCRSTLSSTIAHYLIHQNHPTQMQLTRPGCSTRTSHQHSSKALCAISTSPTLLSTGPFGPAHPPMHPQPPSPSSRSP